MSNKNIGIPVDMIDPETNVVLETFSTMKDASLKTGINRTSISYACTGLNKTAGGYIWRKNFNHEENNER